MMTDESTESEPEPKRSLMSNDEYLLDYMRSRVANLFSVMFEFRIVLSACLFWTTY